MSTSDNFSIFVPVYDAIPEKWEEARALLTERMKFHANCINDKVSGYLVQLEQPSGQKFQPVTGSQQYRSVLRKVIDCGSMPNNSIKNVAHGITFNNQFTLLHIYGATTRPGVLCLPLPFPSGSFANQVRLTMDPTNIIIQTFQNGWDLYTRTFVIVEYIQEI